MYAIVEIAGQQYKVEKGQQIYVHRLEQEEGSDVEFNDILLIENDGKVSVGKPNVEGAMISAKVLEHVKGDKVLVFKKKRRKGYQKLNGHRQQFSKLEIGDILEKGARPVKKESKATEEPKAGQAEKPKTEAKKPATKETAKPKAEKPEEKKESKATAAKTAASKSVKKEESAKEKKAEPKVKTAKPAAEKKEEKKTTEKKEKETGKGEEKSES